MRIIMLAMRLKIFLIILFILSLVACSGSSSKNQAPSVNAGSDRVIKLPTNSLQLSASVVDKESDISDLDISWGVTSGESMQVTFDNKNSLSPFVQFNAIGEYTLRLTVVDGSHTVYDELNVSVRASNEAPLVELGENQSISLPYQKLTLSSEVSDDLTDVAQLQYQWKLLEPTNANVVIENANSAAATITLNDIGQYTFSLTVQDDIQESSDTIQVTLYPQDTPGMTNRPSNANCLAPQLSAPTPTSIALEKAFPNLPGMGAVVALLQAPNDDSIWYAVQQNGLVVKFDNNASISNYTSFIDIRDKVYMNDPSELGLLGMAFHPQYDGENNSEVFVYYTENNNAQTRSVIARLTPNGADWTEQRILVLEQPANNHNGGNIAFGPDNYLYIGLGDGGGGNDPYNGDIGHGQDTSTLLGSILRIDVMNQSPYEIPNGNPFNGNPMCSNPDVVNHAQSCPEIYAWGLRNPWRWSFDKENGQFWLGDVGQDTREEVDIIELGNNYGWKITEGDICRPPTNTCDTNNLTAPVHDYSHVDLNRSIVGGYVYRGINPRLNYLQGRYLYADTYSGRIWSLEQNGAGYDNQELIDTNLIIYSFAQANSGELYVLNPSANTGENIYKIIEPAQSVVNQVAEKLSLTGCTDPIDPRKPATGVIPFMVNVILWTDNAIKERYMAIPDGSTIDVDADGDFTYPVGSVLIKHFRLNGRYIETRLLMHHESGWAGYSYEWQYDENDVETDAYLLPGSKSKQIENQGWFYPSRQDCFSCHNNASGTVVGAETLQLNGEFRYWQDGLFTANQLTTLESIGLFTAPLTATHKQLSLSRLQDDTQSYQDKAKSYLHANCAFCHQPGGNTFTSMDLRFVTAFQDMNICNTYPQRDDFGLANPLLLDPTGNYDQPNSIIVRRMESNSASGVRMPPLGTAIVDPLGVSTIKNWVNDLQTCP